jgi:hypothetical protein
LYDEIVLYLVVFQTLLFQVFGFGFRIVGNQQFVVLSFNHFSFLGADFELVLCECKRSLELLVLLLEEIQFQLKLLFGSLKVFNLIVNLFGGDSIS